MISYKHFTDKDYSEFMPTEIFCLHIPNRRVLVSLYDFSQLNDMPYISCHFEIQIHLPEKISVSIGDWMEYIMNATFCFTTIFVQYSGLHSILYLILSIHTIYVLVLCQNWRSVRVNTSIMITCTKIIHFKLRFFIFVECFLTTVTKISNWDSEGTLSLFAIMS